MLNLLRAGALLLAAILLNPSALLAQPSTAQEGCRPLEAVVAKATAMAEGGARLYLWREDEARRAMAALRASHGEPPRPLEPDLVILLVGPEAAVVLFGEGVQVCLILPLLLPSAAALERAVTGDPA
jgi:hypothetical protein